MAQKLRQVESPIKPQTSSSEAMPGFVIEGGVIIFHHYLDGGRGNASSDGNGHGS